MIVASFACFADPPSVGDDGTNCLPVEAPDGGGDCPSICNGGCVENECQIVCSVDRPCNAMTMQCPDSLACDIDCAGDGVCADAHFGCPNDFACSLTCEGPGACTDAELTCGFSECAIECGAPESSCGGTLVRCGAGACLGDCIPGASPTLDRCDEACACERC